jgi:alkaline phosphatase D
VELFLLDTRMFRSPNADPDGPDKTLLGREQMTWLKSGLQASSASFKVILSSVPFDFCRAIDTWQVFAAEREALFSFVRDAGIRGVVLVSADRHYFAVHAHANGLREYHLGPMAAGLGSPPPEHPAVVAGAHTVNYGQFVVVGGDSPYLLFICRDDLGAELFREVLMPGYDGRLL